MEELTSGDPDDWVAAPGTGPMSGYGPAGHAGPVATLDLTEDVVGGVDAPRFGPAVDLDEPAGFAGPSSPAMPSAPPRIKFTTFVVTEADRLLGTAYLLTGDRSRAEELLRAALASAGVNWQRSRSDPADDVLRAMARRCAGPLWWDRPTDALPLTGEIGAGLAQLGSRHRVAIVLRYHQRLTEEQTAAALGAPVGNVRGWLSRALDQLGIDTRLDLRPEAGPGLSRGGLSTELAALAAEHPEAAQPETASSETASSETAPSETALPETALPETAPPETAPPERVLREKASPVARLETAPFDEALRLEARLADVRRRLPALRRRERRRRAAVGTAIGAVSVAVIAGALALAGPVPDPILRKDTISLPPASLGPSAAELFDPRNQRPDPNRFSFQTNLDGDPLLDSRIGDRGQTDVVLRFTPATTNLAFSDFCQTWDTNGPWMSATLNGHHLSLGQCSADDRANAVAYARDDYPTVVGAGWSLEGVRVGRESVLRLRLTSSNGTPLRDDQVQGGRVRMGIAVYQLNAPRVVSSGVIIKRQAENNGIHYSLGGYRTAPITASRRELSLNIPAVTSAALVQVGLPNSNSASMEPFRVMVDGTEAKAVSTGGPITFTLPDAGPHVLSIHARRDDTGVMLLTWYQSLNEPVK